MRASYWAQAATPGRLRRTQKQARPSGILRGHPRTLDDGRPGRGGAGDCLIASITCWTRSSRTTPWTAAVPMTKTESPMFEYACHEGNYSMAGILGGARAQRRRDS